MLVHYNVGLGGKYYSPVRLPTCVPTSTSSSPKGLKRIKGQISLRFIYVYIDGMYSIPRHIERIK